MQTITTYALLLILSLIGHYGMAQDSIPKPINGEKIRALKDAIKNVEIEEKEQLKAEVQYIEQQLEKGEITQEKAKKLKIEKAKKRALNIENRIAILNNKIALFERNADYEKGEENVFRIGTGEEGGSFIYFGKVKNDKPKKFKYDLRTKSDFVLAFGLNNAIIEGQSLEDSPYKFGGSRFFEIGWAWKYRLFKNTNFVRLKYGASLQINGLKPKDNLYFVKNDDLTSLETFPENLKKSKLSLTNLVVPIHFEFGGSKKIEKEDYFRYSTKNKLKFGLGGYGGFNIGARQKLKYDFQGERTKDKKKRGLNTSDLVYGLSSYIAVGGTALYVKYDLSPMFRNQRIDQNNISVGIRFDMD